MLTSKKKSQKQEKRVADEMKARVVLASGALWGSKGDVRNDNLLMECKTTCKPYYTFKFSVWDKILKEAIKDGLRLPVMSIDLEDGKTRLAVFETKDFKMMPGFSDMNFGVSKLYIHKDSFRLTSPCIFHKIGEPYNPETIIRTYCAVPWEQFVELFEEEN